MKARLAVLKEGRMDYAVPVAASPTTIGRDAGNLVQLSNPEVSKRHAVVQAKAGAWTITDLNSRNGVVVNGVRVASAALRSGDRIGIGPCELIFETVADDAEWVPVHVIDLSTNAGRNTMPRAQPPSRTPGNSVKPR